MITSANGVNVGLPGLRSSSNYRAALRRSEALWAWLSIVVLLICWDAATRLDEAVPPLRRIAEAEEQRVAQNALIPVSARPTVNW